MKKLSGYFLIIIPVMLSHTSLMAQSEEKVLSYDSAKGSPPAALDDIAWISGRWKGAISGLNVEEIWSTQSNGSMTGMVKLVADGEIKFHEMMEIITNSKSILLRMKHIQFNATAWEDQINIKDFPLVKIMGNKVFFDQVTFEKVSDKKMIVYLNENNKRGISKLTRVSYDRQE